MNEKYLITTDGWFVAPDGNQYKAVWGEVELMEDSILGIRTNAKSANWYAMIGTKQNHVIVAGCQIHYAVKCDERPYTEGSFDWQMDAKDYQEKVTPTRIYIAD